MELTKEEGEIPPLFFALIGGITTTCTIYIIGSCATSTAPTCPRGSCATTKYLSRWRWLCYFYIGERTTSVVVELPRWLYYFHIGRFYNLGGCPTTTYLVGRPHRWWYYFYYGGSMTTYMVMLLPPNMLTDNRGGGLTTLVVAILLW